MTLQQQQQPQPQQESNQTLLLSLCNVGRFAYRYDNNPLTHDEFHEQSQPLQRTLQVA
jgi:hypothetical protein